MKWGESKELVEILNRLIEGNHTPDDIVKFKERCISENCRNYPIDVPHLFVQNSKVYEFSNRVHMATASDKDAIKALDNVEANAAELRDKISNEQIRLDPRRTMQLAFILQLAEGERTEIAVNIRTDDGMTNVIIRKIQLHARNRPSGIIWVQIIILTMQMSGKN